MKTRNIILAASAMLALSACGAETPVKVTETNNPNVPVGILFEIDGCRVYRFEDNNRLVYFSNCYGSVTAADKEHCGKGCTRHVNRTVETRIIPDEQTSNQPHRTRGR